MVANNSRRRLAALAAGMAFSFFFVVDTAAKPASVIGPFVSLGQCQAARDVMVRQGYRLMINCWEAR